MMKQITIEKIPPGDPLDAECCQLCEDGTEETPVATVEVRVDGRIAIVICEDCARGLSQAAIGWLEPKQGGE